MVYAQPTLIPSNLTYLLDAPHPFWKRRDRCKVESYKLTFRSKRALRRECINVCHESQNKSMLLELKALRDRVLPRRMAVSGPVESVATTNPFELAIAWPKLAVDVASALFDSALGDHSG